MTDFEDGLWSKLVSDHGAQLSRIGPRPHNRPRRSWRAPLAAGGIALAGVILAAVLTVTASDSPPAYALVVNPNGSVTLTINELIGVSEANTRLAELGVRARVAKFKPHCTARGNPIPFPRPHPGSLSSTENGTAGIVEPELLRHGRGPFGRVRMVIHPGAIPPGDTLLLTVRAHNLTYHGTPMQALGMSTGLYRGPAPTCNG